ncbi:hypothetical protein F3Y22_tig00111440pilonHSYRG00014 [Hibiscus syriacus]|uniref:Uncharacterized protein n=1 Tax=Hibiscus syriacus TaxID=106335 RepID=A0A6A2Y384_HIBSY|nr:hypothetical protein F3Y22_tig00111440pilonHSYRG00014 [Hibiscus syriacus]
MDGIGKTTLVDAVYNEISLEFESRCFVHNVTRQIEDKVMLSVRNELLSKLLGNETDIDTPTIGCPVTQERLDNIKSIVVLDNVNDPEHIDLMGMKYFGEGSKIIITSSDRQVLKNGGADEIYKQSNSPPAGFPYWNKISRCARGNPYVLKVLGSKLHTIPEKEWGGEVDKLRKYPHSKILQVTMSSFDDLDEIEKNIFLDISCFFKGEVKEEEEEILSCLYEGTVSGINTLLNKCLLDIDSYRRISMHDMLEEMGKDIVHQESKDPEKRSRLWDFKEVNQVHRYNKENTSIEGIKFRMTRYDPLLSCRHGFENMLNLRYIDLSTGCLMFQNDKVLAHKVDSLSFPDELRYLYWSGYPFKSLSPNYNPKNLAVLKLRFGCMEQLWNGDHQDLVNLRIIDLSDCVKLRKIPNLSGAINLNSFFCRNEVPENVFYYGSMNYSFDLKITLNGFKLTSTSGEKFTSECHVSLTQDKIFRYKTDCNPWLRNFNFMGDHVFILFNQDMIIIDNDYEEASFELYIGNLAGDEFKVEKCGNSDSQEDANIEGAPDGSATEIRPGDERRFGNGGEEDGGYFQGHHLTVYIVMLDWLFLLSTYDFDVSFTNSLRLLFLSLLLLPLRVIRRLLPLLPLHMTSLIQNYCICLYKSTTFVPIPGNKKIFLDIAFFSKEELREDVDEILSCFYKGVVSGISNLIDKTLLHMGSNRQISMYEEMGKDLVRQMEDLCGGYFGGHYLTDYIAMLQPFKLFENY